MASRVPRKKRNLNAANIQGQKCASLAISGSCSGSICELGGLTDAQANTLYTFYMYGSYGPMATFGGYSQPQDNGSPAGCPGAFCPWEAQGDPTDNVIPSAEPVQVRPPTNKMLHDNDVLRNLGGGYALAPLGFFRTLGNSKYGGTPTGSSRDWAIQSHWGPFPSQLSNISASSVGVCRASKLYGSGSGFIQNTSSGHSSRGLLYMHCGGKSGYIPCVHTPNYANGQPAMCTFKIVGPEADTSMSGAWISSSLACTGCVDQPPPMGLSQSWNQGGKPSDSCMAAMKAPPEYLSHIRIGVYGSIGSGSFLNIYCSGSASGPANDGWGVLTGTFSGEDHALANSNINETPNYYRKFFKIPTGSLPIQLSFTASNAETTAKAGLQIYWAPDS